MYHLGRWGSEPLYDEQDRAQFVELLTPSRVLEIVVDDVANTLRLFGLRKSIRNHRASHSVADGDMTKPNGYLHKVTAAHRSDGF